MQDLGCLAYSEPVCWAVWRTIGSNNEICVVPGELLLYRSSPIVHILPRT